MPLHTTTKMLASSCLAMPIVLALTSTAAPAQYYAPVIYIRTMYHQRHIDTIGAATSVSILRTTDCILRSLRPVLSGQSSEAVLEPTSRIATEISSYNASLLVRVRTRRTVNGA